jgi:hypothetical protein
MDTGEARQDVSGPSSSEDLVLGTGSPFSARLLIQQLLGSRRAGKGCARLRQHERYPCCVKVVVQVEEPGSAGKRVRELRGTTQDISAGGMAFLCDLHVAPGSVVRVSFEACADAEPLTGVVRRCAGVPGEPFVVGVQFEES